MPLPPSKNLPPGSLCDLVILATSDLHLALCPWDFHADLPVAGKGYAPVAALIEDLRAKHQNLLLVDNGDALQGDALGEALVAMHLPSTRRPHPMIQMMNLMRYDAFGLGNHELDFGLEFLSASLSGANFPVLCANLHPIDGKTYPFTGSVLLERRVVDAKGKSQVLKIGIFSVMPTKVVQWNALNMKGHFQSQDMVEAAQATTERLRRQGADLVLALCHCGIVDQADHDLDESAALRIAQIDGVDAIVAGHTHEVFPSQAFRDQPDIDIQSGHLAGKPAVMPGRAGSHLGYIQLRLHRARQQKWRVIGGEAEALCVRGTRPDPAPCQLTRQRLQRICQDTRSMSRRYLNRRAGVTSTPLHSYYAQIERSPATPLIGDACRWHMRSLLAGGPFSDRPILAAVALARCGGRDGPLNYIDLAAGPLVERDLITLKPYHNAITALEISGTDLRAWLEHSAASFHQIQTGSQDHPLMRAEIAPYHCDVIEGVCYEIDLSRAGRDSQAGIAGDRITSLLHEGRPIAPDDRFIIVTTAYRASGGGNYPSCGRPDNVVLASPTLLRSIVGAYLTMEGPYTPPPRSNWRFRPMPGTTVTLDTGPNATAHPPPEGVEFIGPTSEGFLKLRISL